MSTQSESSVYSEPLFHEEQRFQQKPLWALMVFFFVIEFALIIVPLVRIWVFGETIDGSDRSDPIPVLTGIFVMGVLGGLMWLLWKLRLVTEVHREGVHVRMIPFHRRVQAYPFDKIATFEAVTYRPIRDYGGWGIRYGRKGRAFNVRGNKGVMLQLTEERPLLIGTQRLDEFEAALRSVFPTKP